MRAVLAGHIAHHVLVDHHVVGRADQLGEPDAQLLLARGRHFVVMLLDRHPQLTHGQQHLAADVLEGVAWGDGGIALLRVHLVGQIAALLQSAAVPGGFDRIDAVETASLAGAVAHVFEQEELQLRSEVGRVGQARAGQMSQGPLGQRPGATPIGLAAAGLLNRADQAEGLVAKKGINPGGGRIGHHRHVRFIDRLPAPDRGAIKGQAASETTPHSAGPCRR